MDGIDRIYVKSEQSVGNGSKDSEDNMDDGRMLVETT